MRPRTIAILSAGALVLSGCGSSNAGVTAARPAAPVALSVFIGANRVSVSPSGVGAGPVQFVITNQAARAESVSVLRSGGGAPPLADTGPINPRATAQLTVDFTSPGSYSLAAGGSSDGSGSSIRRASLHVGAPRPSSDNQLLLP